MGVSFASKAVLAPAPKKKRNGNTKPLPVTLPLDQPGRLREGHLLTLLSISGATLRTRIKNGTVPPCDGHDGYVGRWLRPYWDTETIRKYLAGGGAG
ncbi:hypothetical protein [Paraburkholderia caffeinilytica]|uniref:hypothetical protein n=1 Tax=Paraburkholderia caffeinilytica TaxID=1761016 RepID=UPI003D9FF5A5